MRTDLTAGTRVAVFDVVDGYPSGGAHLGEIIDSRDERSLLVQFDDRSRWTLVSVDRHIVPLRGAQTDPYAISGRVVEELVDGGVLVHFDRIPLVARDGNQVTVVARSDAAFERHLTRRRMLASLSEVLDAEHSQLLARILPRAAAEIAEESELEAALAGPPLSDVIDSSESSW